MDFGLSSDQQQFSETLKQLLAEGADTAAVLRVSDASGFDPKLWGDLCSIGAPALGLPEEEGGLGASCLDGVVLAEALGYAVAPVPSLAPWHLVPFLLAQSPADMRRKWLSSIADGTARIALAIEEAGSSIALHRDGAIVDGTVRNLAEGAHATHLLVLLDDVPILIDLRHGNCVVGKIPSLDRTVPLADVSLHQCPATVLSELRNTKDIRRDLTDRARVLLAAQSVGAAQSMLDEAVSYVQVRRQFGQALANFQSVRHACAEMATMIEPARSLVWYAAHLIDIQDTGARVASCHSKAYADEVGRDVATLATQLHGAMGFTHELGLHLRLKRIASNRQLYGTPEQCRFEAVALQTTVPELEQRNANG